MHTVIRKVIVAVSSSIFAGFLKLLRWGILGKPGRSIYNKINDWIQAVSRSKTLRLRKPTRE